MKPLHLFAAAAAVPGCCCISLPHLSCFARALSSEIGSPWKWTMRYVLEYRKETWTIRIFQMQIKLTMSKDVQYFPSKVWYTFLYLSNKTNHLFCQSLRQFVYSLNEFELRRWLVALAGGQGSCHLEQEHYFLQREISKYKCKHGGSHFDWPLNCSFSLLWVTSHCKCYSLYCDNKY